MVEGGKLTEKQEVWLESSRFDWKILLSGAFRCADRRSLKKAERKKSKYYICIRRSCSLCPSKLEFGSCGSLRLLTYLSQA